MTLEDALVFDLAVWDDVSAHAKDLISKLLVKDPKRRISLEDAMNHPWFEHARRKHEQQNLQTSSTKKLSGTSSEQKKSSFANKSPARQAAAANTSEAAFTSI